VSFFRTILGHFVTPVHDSYLDFGVKNPTVTWSSSIGPPRARGGHRGAVMFVSVSDAAVRLREADAAEMKAFRNPGPAIVGFRRGCADSRRAVLYYQGAGRFLTRLVCPNDETTQVISYAMFKSMVVQSSVFIIDPGFNTSRALTFFTAHNEELSQLLFSSDFTADTPLELPRLLIQSKDGVKKLQAGPGRIDLILESQRSNEEIDVVGSLAWSKEVLCAYVEHSKARVFRLACVLTRRADADDPSRLAAEHFCQPFFVAPSGAMAGTDDFEIRFRKRFELKAGVIVNNWARCLAGPSLHPTLKEPRSKRALSLEQDINTIVEYSESRTFERVEVEEFFALVPAQFDKAFRDLVQGAHDER
jgi:hypothetical protein